MKEKQVKATNSSALLKGYKIKCPLLEDIKEIALCLTKERALLDKSCLMNK
jgi:hypothetical protein